MVAVGFELLDRRALALLTFVDALGALNQAVAATCDRVTGEDCFIARVHVRSVADLERVIDRIIPHAMTNTAIIQSSPVPARLPVSDQSDS